MRNFLLCLTAVLSLGTQACAQSNSSNWYPSSIALPGGRSYPCALTALPPDLAGIPAGDRVFINHTYAMILKCLQAKLIMLEVLFKNNQSYSAAYSQYYRDTLSCRQKILAEPVPAGLETFRTQVANAIAQQMQFFAKAVKARESGQSAQDMMNIPEGKAASGLLQNAWSSMSSRYSSWSPGVRDSIYHHLCALDLF